MKKNEKLNRAVTNNQGENKKTEMPKNEQQGGANALMVVKDEQPTEPEVEPIKEALPVPPVAEVSAPKVLTIEERLKHVELLHRMVQQRQNLIARTNQLEAFEIAISDDADELEPNSYQTCKLAIFDDKGRQFTVQSGGLIKLVVDFIKNACAEKVTELDTQIIFPAA